MRLKFPIVFSPVRMATLLKGVCWSDPLVQTWGLMSGLLIVGIVSHYGPRSESGEKKLPPAGALFYTKPVLSAEDWRPGVPFSPDNTVACVTSPACEVDLRACADRAAQSSGWRYLTTPLRARLNAVAGGISRITVTWSGTRGGDAETLDYYYSGTQGLKDGVPGDFIIGNGCRGKDGCIETTRWGTKTLAGPAAGETPPNANTGISICLVGEGQKPTPAQERALGELITCIESRTGTTALAMRQPQSASLLAGY
jgi:hypothetical protein